MYEDILNIIARREWAKLYQLAHTQLWVKGIYGPEHLAMLVDNVGWVVWPDVGNDCIWISANKAEIYIDRNGEIEVV